MHRRRFEIMTFRPTHPRLNGLTILSRVGLNKAMDEALVYTWQFCGGDCGEGGYFLMKKQSGHWQITSHRFGSLNRLELCLVVRFVAVLPNVRET